MRFLRLLSFLSAFLPGIALAQIAPCPLGSIIPCGTGGASGASAFIGYELLPELRIAIAGIMLFFFVYYALRLILESDQESTVTETKQAYGYAVTGAVFISVASLVALGVGSSASRTLINSDTGGPIWTIFALIITYMRWLMGTIVMVFIAFQGIRLMVLNGQESEVEKQRTRFFHGLIGVAVVLLASTIVSSVTQNDAGLLGEQGKALANLLLEVFGFLVVLSFIVAGVMLVFSTDEGLKDRAKKVFYGSVVGLVVVFCCYSIITFVLSV